jgi:hypothetical protein
MDDNPTITLRDRAVFAGNVLVASTLSYLLIVSIYRLYFHPLAKFPGPILNRISWVLHGPCLSLSSQTSSSLSPSFQNQKLTVHIDSFQV